MRVPSRMSVLILSACSLMMAPASAQDEHVTRPLKMMVQSQMVISPSDWSCTAHAEGVVSHFGLATMEGWGELTNPHCEGTITAANGDWVVWEGNLNTGVYSIKGGTGRFEGATGEFTLLAEMVSQVVDEETGTITNTFIWTASGTISY